MAEQENNPHIQWLRIGGSILVTTIYLIGYLQQLTD